MDPLLAGCRPDSSTTEHAHESSKSPDAKTPETAAYSYDLPGGGSFLMTRLKDSSEFAEEHEGAVLRAVS